MKAIKFLTVLLAAVLTLSVSAQAQNKKKEAPKMAEVTFSADIHCNSCKNKVDAALPYIKGVKDFKVSVEERTVWFKYDATKVTKQKLGAELAELGFPAKEIVKAENK